MALHPPVGFRRDRDLINGRQRADHVNRATDGILANDFDLDRLGAFRAPGLGHFTL